MQFNCISLNVGNIKGIMVKNTGFGKQYNKMLYHRFGSSYDQIFQIFKYNFITKMIYY